MAHTANLHWLSVLHIVMEVSMLLSIHLTLSSICCMAQETQTGVLYQPRGVEWGGRWEGGSKWR